MIKYGVFFLIIFTSGCVSEVDKMNKVYASRKEIIDLFLKKEITKARDQTTIYFYTYSAKKKMNTFLKKEPVKYSF